jgi:hypothetical protein
MLAGQILFLCGGQISAHFDRKAQNAHCDIDPPVKLKHAISNRRFGEAATAPMKSVKRSLSEFGQHKNSDNTTERPRRRVTAGVTLNTAQWSAPNSHPAAEVEVLNITDL